MPGFGSVRQYVDAIEGGQSSVCSIRKVPSQATIARQWADLSMAAGNPRPNYYASSPLEAATLDGFSGIFHGDDKSPYAKYLTHLALSSPTAGFVGQFSLMDYLLYYPFVDMDDTDEQVMTNSVTLPRYATGEDVMAMMVAVAPTTGGGSFIMNYTDSDGNAKVSPTNFCGTSVANIATIVTAQPAVAGNLGAFLTIADPAKGIRSVESVTFVVPNGGLAALVLVKPLHEHAIHEIRTTSEISFVDKMYRAPRIYDGAYLNLIVRPAATIATGLLTGRANFAWN